MKHKNSVTQTYIKRDCDILPTLFKQARTMAVFPTTMRKICTIAAGLPTPFFCISDDAALDYARKRYLNGLEKHFKSPYKQRLFNAFWDKFLEIKTRCPQMSLQSAVFSALACPAPCVGLTPWIIQFKVSRILRIKSQKPHLHPPR